MEMSQMSFPCLKLHLLMWLPCYLRQSTQHHKSLTRLSWNYNNLVPTGKGTQLLRNINSVSSYRNTSLHRVTLRSTLQENPPKNVLYQQSRIIFHGYEPLHRTFQLPRRLLGTTSPSPSSSSSLWQRLEPYAQLMRLDKPIGTWLLLLPCYWSIFMGNNFQYAVINPRPATPAGSLPHIKLVALFGLGAVVMRGAGCTLNDLIDLEIDKQVERTRNRPLASGRLSPEQAIKFLIGQLSVGLGVLLSLNTYSIVLGSCSLIIVSIYPWMKRVTNWPQAVLGLAFNWGILLGYSATAGWCDWSICLPLYAAGISWTLVYDTIYALQDAKDDNLIGVKSTALRFGGNTKRWLTLFATTTIASLTWAGIAAGQSWPFFAATLGGAAHLAWQIKTLDVLNASDCLAKFKSNRDFGLIIAAGALLANFV